jgi:hypothetical protein
VGVGGCVDIVCVHVYDHICFYVYI